MFIRSGSMILYNISFCCHMFCACTIGPVNYLHIVRCQCLDRENVSFRCSILTFSELPVQLLFSEKVVSCTYLCTVVNNITEQMFCCGSFLYLHLVRCKYRYRANVFLGFLGFFFLYLHLV